MRGEHSDTDSCFGFWLPGCNLYFGAWHARDGRPMELPERLRRGVVTRYRDCCQRIEWIDLKPGSYERERTQEKPGEALIGEVLTDPIHPWRCLRGGTRQLLVQRSQSKGIVINHSRPSNSNIGHLHSSIPCLHIPTRFVLALSLALNYFYPIQTSYLPL
ncbi:hypothetical protein ASPVEDRAFT_543719 [Aspergillus versicolor CBS 583.65]|uniref:Uncharacterized protein n=1 Tax=Aspergillus versicolor CBS 583.65 TaxID=1036611 RepID=A0A1L9PF62_ASPVE|nr:uncharacterized protein ASPVEDRAFT_543719 [Aspergillus versicolor CBS 583.65]OJJ00086.1 hypothetical protein ASPVEDRAFT_543719 [Aspergillus versicolor CBS 583.65]